MSIDALSAPTTDPTPIFEHFRGNHASELLTAAITHFNVFASLHRQPCSLAELGQRLSLETRPTTVLVTALRAMGLLQMVGDQLHLTPLAQEHLVPDAAFDCGDYVGLAAQSPGVLQMVNLLKTNQPLGSEDDGPGAAFIYRDAMASAMESSHWARHFTMALAGRAKNVAPALAQAIDLSDAKALLDIGAGTGIYSYALLQRFEHLNAVLFDRPEVINVAQSIVEDYAVQERCQFSVGDMFAGPLPRHCDAILLSNILHDWDTDQCAALIAKCADALPEGGRLLIHDVFLDDTLDGPLPVALYSASLFSFTQGRAYSGAEYRNWLLDAGLTPQPIVPTAVHCGVLAAVK